MMFAAVGDGEGLRAPLNPEPASGLTSLREGPQSFWQRCVARPAVLSAIICAVTGADMAILRANAGVWQRQERAGADADALPALRERAARGAAGARGLPRALRPRGARHHVLPHIGLRHVRCLLTGCLSATGRILMLMRAVSSRCCSWPSSAACSPWSHGSASSSASSSRTAAARPSSSCG